jgi:hypothetical protein
MIYAIIAAAIGVVALCLHYGTRSYGLPYQSRPQGDMRFYKYDKWDKWNDGIVADDAPGTCVSDGSDGSIPGDPWGTIYHDDD